MAEKLRVNVEFTTDKSKNPLTSSEYIKHGNQWLSDAMNAAATLANSKADKTYVDTELAKKADSTTVSSVSDRVSEIETEQTALSARMDTFTHLEEGSTTGDAELIDGRVGADGKTYANIGEAIRGQVTDLKNEITKTNSNVDLMFTAKQLAKTENGYFYYQRGEKKTSNYVNAHGFALPANAKKINIKAKSTAYYDIYTFVNSLGNTLDYKYMSSAVNFEEDVYIPDGAAMVYVSGNSVSATIKAYIPKSDVIEDELNLVESSLYSETQISGLLVRYWYNNSEKTETPNYVSGVLYDVNKCKTIKISANMSAYYNIYTMLDASNNVIKYERVSSAGTVTDKVVDVPIDAVYCHVSSTSGVSVSATMLESKKTSRELAEDAEFNHPIKRKTIIWLGTSIPAGGKDGRASRYTYPKIVGKMLDCNVINLAVGTSPVHICRESLKSTDNPYGFVLSNFEASSRCLTNTTTMMQWIIDNKNKFTSAPSTLTQEDKDFIMSCSYENKILPYLDEDEDYIWIFDHGFNDNMQDESDYNNADKYNTNTFQGACNFIFRTILSKKPKSTIIMIGDYENQLKISNSEYQEIVADRWGLPFLKMWEHLGWSQEKINTTGDWVNGYWVDDAVPGGHEMTMLQVALPDGVHPHTDMSFGAIHQIAMIISKWVDSQGFYKPISQDYFNSFIK